MKYFLLLIFVLPFLSCAQTGNTTKMEETKKENLSDLHYLVREQKDTKIEAPVLILLHGYGSNENDLFSFAKQIPDDWLVISVRAPLPIANNRFKWYDVKLVDKKITMNFADEEKSRKSLLKLIDQIVSKYKVDTSKIVTAGFSQGANMALGLALTEPKKILAAGCFSGRFMEEIKPLIQDKATLKSKQVFLAHGTEDQMLPLQYAEENKAILEGFGINVKLSTDQVAHSISSKHLSDFVKWMKNL